MADPRLGIAFLAERQALIQEIARNLFTESLPSIRTDHSAPPKVVTEAGLTSPDDPLLADSALTAREQPGSGSASLLAGMKLPNATFVQPDDYRQALAQFAKSDPAMAAVIESAAQPDTVATGGIASPPGDVAAETDPNPAVSIDAETDVEVSPSPSLRREAAAPTNTVSTPIADAIVASAAALAPDALAPDALASTEAVVERALLSLGLAEGGAANPAALRGELGGIIASFILNAHFQPGWPPLRPIQDPEAKALVAQLAKDPKLSKDDIAMLTYLANFGLNRTQLARILKLVASATNRSKLLEAIAHLLANIGTLLGAVHAEIEALADEIRETAAGRPRRERLTLR